MRPSFAIAVVSTSATRILISALSTPRSMATPGRWVGSARLVMLLHRSQVAASIPVAVMAAVMVVATVGEAMVAGTAVAVTGEGMAVVVLIPSPSPARRVKRMLTVSPVRTMAAELIRVVAQIPATAVAAAQVAVRALLRPSAAATLSSARSSSSSGALAVRPRAWAARSRVIPPIAKLHTSAMAMQLPVGSWLSCVSSCAAPVRGTATAHSPATEPVLSSSCVLVVIPLRARS